MSSAKGHDPGISQSRTTPANRGVAEFFYTATAISLAISALLFFVFSWHWPLVGDASAMHYLAFLIQRGWAPYRELGDQQFPGAYLVELAGMRVFGMSSLSWRIYDFTLLAIATAAFFAVTRSDSAPSTKRRTSWLPGLFAASLFILIHGRDGLEQGGQRDFVMAVLLVTATAFLFAAFRRDWFWSSAIFGLLSGLAFSIKPTVLPLSFAQILFACYVAHRRGSGWLPHAVCASVAYLIAPAASIIFLLRHRAFSAFLAGFRGVVPYYASLAHRPLTYILVHSVSPVLLMVYIWIVLRAFMLFNPEQALNLTRSWEYTTLLASAAFGLLDCILQARALPYYRYPLLAFLLPVMALDFHSAVQRSLVSPNPATPPLPRKTIITLGVAASAFGAFIVAPQSAILIHRYRWQQTDFITSLEQNLNALGGSALSRHIQYIDSVSGCPTTFYRLRLEPASGVLGDYLLFGPDSVPIVQQSRRQFAADIFADPPKVIVVSSHLHLGDLEDFHKLDRWPALKDFLSSHYDLATEWNPTRPALWWSRPEIPASYRIYVLKK